MTTTALDLMPLSRKQIISVVESSQARISIWEGAVRSGKTLSSLLAFLAAVAEAPPAGLILIIGRTLQTIERNIITPLTDTSLFGTMAFHTRHTRGAGTATIMGREVHLIGASDARAEGRLRGLTAYLVMVDEATLLPEEFFTQLLARLSVPGARLLATTNPGAPRHWLRTKFLLRQGELDLKTWHFTLDDNPSLDPVFVANLKSEFTGMWYRRFIEGEWCVAEGAIYEMWDPEKHVAPPESFPPMDRILSVGVDYGDDHPTRGYLIGLGPDTRPGSIGHRLYILSEWAPGRMTIGEHSTSLRTWLAQQPEAWRVPNWVAVDPAAASFKHQLFHDGMTNTRNAHNSVLPGIRTLAGLLAAGKLVVSDTCDALITEIPGYIWDAAASERGDDKPVKKDDDCCDAARYGIFTTRLDWVELIPLAPVMPWGVG